MTTTTGTLWVDATTRDQVPLREGRAIRIGALDLALFNLGEDRFLAVDGTCPHQGGPLCDGIIAGDTVVCPLHAWKVNLVTGAVERPVAVTACIDTYPTRVSGETVLIEIPAAAITAEA
jgi:nitrite reductase (NADH) small subunit